MSEPTIVIVGLKEECFNDKELAETVLYSSGYGYGESEVWSYVLEEKKDNCFQKTGEAIAEDEDRGSIYGIGVAGTWNGAVLLDDILKPIEEAKTLFKKITGQEGKIYIIGEQE